MVNAAFTKSVEHEHRATTRSAIAEPSSDSAVPLAVIDGPYDALALSKVLARTPIDLGNSGCSTRPNTACDHGTFIMGILGAREDAVIPGLCPACQLLHIALFLDERAPSASIGELANAITISVAAGARLINLSLAILGDDSQNDPELAAALDYAEANDAVILVAAGNQGHLAIGQLLSHRVTIPVVAVDAVHSLVPGCNFGPGISRRGVAALGYQVLGYAPGAGTAVMSGTSVATAIATGTLGYLWSARAEAKGADIRAAVARLGPRDGLIPPTLDRNAFLVALDGNTVRVRRSGEHDLRSYVTLQGDMKMNGGIEQPSLPNRGAPSATAIGHVVTPASGLHGCACGSPGGICTCKGSDSPGRFVYVLGTVDVRFPDLAIAEELETVARSTPNFATQGPYESTRHYCWRVLGLKTPDGRILARHVARQACWVLKVEGQIAYYLSLDDLDDLPDLISCLERPESGDYVEPNNGDQNSPNALGRRQRRGRQGQHQEDGDHQPPAQYPRQEDLDLFVGSSSLTPIEACPGVMAPVLGVERMSSLKKETIVSWCKPPGATGMAPNPDLFERLVRSADNFGDDDRWRALNYLAVQYMPIYEKYAQLANDHDLVSIDVVPSRLSRERRLVDPVFAFRHRTNGVVQKYFVRVDVSHMFPMIANPLVEYFDR